MTDPQPIADPLAARLVPVAVQAIEALTRRATALSTREPGELDDPQLHAALAALADESERLGWCLAVIGSATAGDLTLARREPRGLEWMAELVGRAGGALASGTPRLRAALPDGWSVAYAFAALAIEALEASWGLSQDTDCMVLSLRGNPSALAAAWQRASGLRSELTWRDQPAGIEGGLGHGACGFPSAWFSGALADERDPDASQP